jgi:hypothetical protein
MIMTHTTHQEKREKIIYTNKPADACQLSRKISSESALSTAPAHGAAVLRTLLTPS